MSFAPTCMSLQLQLQPLCMFLVLQCIAQPSCCNLGGSCPLHGIALLRSCNVPVTCGAGGNL